MECIWKEMTMKLDLTLAANLSLSAALSENLCKTFEKLTFLAEEATRFGTLGDDNSVRSALDQMRQVWSSVPEDYRATSSNLHFENQQKFKKLADDFEKKLTFIHAWSTRFEPIIDNEEFRKSEEGLQYLIDSRLPPVWNWETDVVVLFSRQKNKLAKLLKRRGQKNIFVVRGRVTKNLLDHCKSIFLGDDLTGKRRLKVIEAPISDRQSIEIIKIIEALTSSLQKATIINNTNQRFFRENVLQRLENTIFFIKTLSFEDLRSDISGKPVVIVSPGPSLVKNIDVLRENVSNVVIVAAAQSVPALLRHKIKPDYIVVVDNQNFSEITEGLDYQNTKAIFVDTVHKSFFKHPFKNIFVNFNSHCPSRMTEILNEKNVNIPGGSVSVFAFNLMADLNAGSIALIGQDLSVSEGAYYVGDGWHSASTPPEKLIKPEARYPANFLLPGLHGGKVATQPDYWLFYNQFVEGALRIGVKDSKIKLYNCTEGGAFIDGFIHQPLNKFFKKFASAPLNKSVDVMSLPNAEVSRRARLFCQYIKEIKEKCKKLVIMLHEGKKILSRNGNINQLQHNSVKVQNLILENIELSAMAFGDFEEIERRLRRNKNFQNDTQISSQIYHDLSCDSDVLINACDAAIQALESHMDSRVLS